MSDPKEIGRRIREIRESMGLSELAAATAAGISSQEYVEVEAGSRALDLSLLMSVGIGLHWDWQDFFEHKRVDDLLLTLFRKSERLLPTDKLMLADLYARASLMEELTEAPYVGPKLSIPKDKYFRRQGQALARQVRQKFNLAAGPISNPFALLRDRGIPVFRIPLSSKSLSGATMFLESGLPVILVNRTQDGFRQRFSACHELCHALVDGANAEPVLSFTDDARALIEARANAFAGELLLPSAQVASLWVKHGSNWAAWRDLAIRYGVNLDTLRIAFKDAKLSEAEATGTIEKLKPGEKADPDLLDLSLGSVERAKNLAEEGLTLELLGLVKSALDERSVSWGWCAEKLRVSESRLRDLMKEQGFARILQANFNPRALPA